MIPFFVGGAALVALALSPRPRTWPVRIAVVSDTHLSLARSPAQSAYRSHLARVISQVNEAGVDLVLVAGDLTDGGDAESLMDFRREARRFRAPVRCVPGNHDCGGKLSAGAGDAITEAKLAAYEQVMGRSFGVETVRGVRLVRINASLLASGLPSEARQWALLEREAARTSVAPRVLLLHYPLFLARPEETDGGYWTVDPDARRRLIALAERMGACLVLSGHLHRRLRTSAGGLEMVSAPATSFGLPQGKEPPGWLLVTLGEDGRAVVEGRPLEQAPAEQGVR